MTDEQINIAIAEACGRVRRPDGYWFPLGSNVGSAGIANYCNDLNAMHEAEGFLRGMDWARYFDLIQTCGAASGVRATAHQRAEAFLRTIGKWEESE